MIRILQIIKHFSHCIARLWLLYFPYNILKNTVWEFTSWRIFDFETTTHFGSKISGNTNDIIQKYIYYFGVWEPNITKFIKKNLDNGDIFVDVGANIGYYSLLSSNIVGKEGKVISIEASPYFYNLLEKHVSINNIHNIKLHSAAVLDKTQRITIHHASTTNRGATSVIESFENAFQPDVQVNAEPLSHFIDNNLARRIRIIKIDVEGAEWLVLQGMREIFPLLSNDTYILLEVSPDKLNLFKKSFADVIELFLGYGFYAYKIRNNYSPDIDYFNKLHYTPPTRLKSEEFELIDLVFSKINAEHL